MASSSQEDSSSRTRNYGDGPPWIFTGRALYQLHLVKAEVARHFIPPELKLVQAFGCISCFFNPSFVAISILSFVDPCTTLYLFL
jgi:hypothetical protein